MYRDKKSGTIILALPILAYEFVHSSYQLQLYMIYYSLLVVFENSCYVITRLLNSQCCLELSMIIQHSPTNFISVGFLCMQQEVKFVKFPSNQLVAHIDEIYTEKSLESTDFKILTQVYTCK